MQADGDVKVVAAELISRARAGDGDAFRELTEPHRRELQVHCYRILGSFQDAGDAVQDTLLAAGQGFRGFEGRASLRKWLYRRAQRRLEEEAALARLGVYTARGILRTGLPAVVEVVNQFLATRLFVSAELMQPGFVCRQDHFLWLQEGRCPFCNAGRHFKPRPGGLRVRERGLPRRSVARSAARLGTTPEVGAPSSGAAPPSRSHRAGARERFSSGSAGSN